jgi:hypothetical protein
MVANKSKYDKIQIFGKYKTIQNCIHEEIKSRLNMANACYLAVQNILSSYL